MLLREIKLVDLRRSKYNKRTSDPKNGIYKFEPGGKVYVSWKDPATRPPEYVKWNRNDPRDIARWRTLWNYTEVTLEDPYWPEGMKPNEAGYYVYQTDMILVKCPLEDYVEKRRKEIEISEQASAGKKREFEDIVRKAGASPVEDIEQRIFGELS